MGRKRRRASTAVASQDAATEEEQHSVLRDTLGFYRYLAERSVRSPLFLARTLSHRRRATSSRRGPQQREQLALTLFGVTECSDAAPCINTQVMPARIAVLEEYAPTGSIEGEALYRVADVVEVDVPLLSKIGSASCVGQNVRIPIDFGPIVRERRRCVVVLLVFPCVAAEEAGGGGGARPFGHSGERLGELGHAARVPRGLASTLELLASPPAACGLQSSSHAASVPPCYSAHMQIVGARDGSRIRMGEYSCLLKCLTCGASGVAAPGSVSAAAAKQSIALREPLLNFALKWTVSPQPERLAMPPPLPEKSCSDLPIAYCFWVDRDGGGGGGRGGGAELQLTSTRDTFRCPLCSTLPGDLAGLLCHLRASHSRCGCEPTVTAAGGIEIHLSLASSLVPMLPRLQSSARSSSSSSSSSSGGSSAAATPPSPREVALARVRATPADFCYVGRHCRDWLLRRRRGSVAPVKSSHPTLFNQDAGRLLCDDEYAADAGRALMDAEEADESRWLAQHGDLALDEFDDVSFEEKAFMKIWNGFTRTYTIWSDAFLSRACAIFAVKYGEELLQEKLRHNFLLHLICLWDRGQISSETIAECLAAVDVHAG